MSEATAVKKQTSADLQVKFSKLLSALFSIGQIGHLVKAQEKDVRFWVFLESRAFIFSPY